TSAPTRKPGCRLRWPRVLLLLPVCDTSSARCQGSGPITPRIRQEDDDHRHAPRFHACGLLLAARGLLLRTARARRPGRARLLAARRLLRRTLRSLLGQQLLGAFLREVLDAVGPAQRRVVLAVGHVGAEAAVLDDDRLARDRVLLELLERRLRGGLPAPALRLGVDLQRFLERDVEDLLLGRQRPRVGALLQIRPVPAVLRRD